MKEGLLAMEKEIVEEGKNLSLIKGPYTIPPLKYEERIRLTEQDSFLSSSSSSSAALLNELNVVTSQHMRIRSHFSSARFIFLLRLHTRGI